MKGANESGYRQKPWKLRLYDKLEKLKAAAAEESAKYSVAGESPAQTASHWYYRGKREAFMELLIMLREGKI